MFFKRLDVVAAVLAGLGTTSMGLADGQSPSGNPRPAAAARAGPGPTVSESRAHAQVRHRAASQFTQVAANPLDC